MRGMIYLPISILVYASVQGAIINKQQAVANDTSPQEKAENQIEPQKNVHDDLNPTNHPNQINLEHNDNKNDTIYNIDIKSNKWGESLDSSSSAIEDKPHNEEKNHEGKDGLLEDEIKKVNACIIDNNDICEYNEVKIACLVALKSDDWAEQSKLLLETSLKFIRFGRSNECAALKNNNTCVKNETVNCKRAAIDLMFRDVNEYTIQIINCLEGLIEACPNDVTILTELKIYKQAKALYNEKCSTKAVNACLKETNSTAGEIDFQKAGVYCKNKDVAGALVCLYRIQPYCTSKFQQEAFLTTLKSANKMCP